MMPAMLVLVRLGSRTQFIAGLVTSLMIFHRGCETPAPPPCDGDACEDGGAAGDGGTGGGDDVVGGQGGEEPGGSGGVGGETTGGGPGGSTSPAGGAGGGSAGQGGGGGTCVPTFACGPKNCGMVDDGCGNLLNCDAKDPQTGVPVTCASEYAGQEQGGPMACDPETHTCECVAEGDSEAAMAFCEGMKAEPAVNDYCTSHGGCHTAWCGYAPVPKAPGHCIGSGQSLGEDMVWCCAVTPD